MNHEHEQNHASSPAAEVAPHHDTIEPGQSSRSALLRKPDHAVASGLVQRKARDANGVADGAEDAVAAAASSSGSRLPDTLMRKFESSLGADLSGVRIHTGGASEHAADAVGAKAYTMGNDIHFGAGHYDPSGSDGQHLLAHEVAHTVQQSGGAQRAQFKLEVSSPGDSFEHEADRAAVAMVSGGAATVSGASGLSRYALQRQPSSCEGAAYGSDQVKVSAPSSAQQFDGGTAVQAGPKPPAWVSDDLKRKLTAVTLAESADGQEGDIKWIYLQRVADAGGLAGLKASAAYSGKGIWYRVWLYILGDKTHGDDPLPDTKRFEAFKGKTVATFCKENGWIAKVAVPRAATLKPQVDDMFINPSANPYSTSKKTQAGGQKWQVNGWGGQGNLSDFNNESNSDIYWKKARAYYWLQQDKKVSEMYVKILPAGKNTQVIFNATGLAVYWSTHALPENVPKYVP